MMDSLKREFLELLDKDVEFRYAVAGYLGFSEILRRLDGIAEEQARLREDFNKMLEVIRDLKEGQIRLERRADSMERKIKSLESAMVSGFGELSKFAGLTFEEFVRKFLTSRLRSSGDIPEHAELRRAMVDGEEINIFLEEPLIVGEATGYAESTEEIFKLLKKARIVGEKYSREPRKFLVILAARENAVKEMRRIAEENGVELIVGRIVE
jgi:hypothetical protein